jgi:hypothetical protein
LLKTTPVWALFYLSLGAPQACKRKHFSATIGLKQTGAKKLPEMSRPPFRAFLVLGGNSDVMM